MLPDVVPSANIFTFTWNSNYYKNAPVLRIYDVADVLLNKLQIHRDKVESIQLLDEFSDSRKRKTRTQHRSFS